MTNIFLIKINLERLMTIFERFYNKDGGLMYRIVFSLLLGSTFILASFLPLIVNADIWEGDMDRYRDNAARSYGQYNYYSTYGSPTAPYNPYYRTYNYRYPSYPSYHSYSTYPIYPNTSVYPGYSYNPYNYNPGMYNPNTTFVNPPSSLNYPTGYPVYSETYMYR